MADNEDLKPSVDDVDDDEKVSLKASTKHARISGYGSTTNDTDYVSLPDHNVKASTGGRDVDAQSGPPSLTRRMSSQFVYQVERQRSVADNIGLTGKLNQVVPDSITQHIPGLARRPSQLKLTYFCNICFAKYPIEEGFTLRQCQHQFCPDCIKGFLDNKINNGQVNITCFYPAEFEDSKPCGQQIDEEDIHQIVSSETWEKYQKFKANLENSYARQCPFCDHTQNGDPNQPMMKCENAECGRMYCLYHSNAHDETKTCDEYELSTAKETRMNEMAIQEMGDNVKPCPQCKFRIIKNGGCNHMKCVKCGCSFCWLCMNVIEDEELPQHYKDPLSPCKGQQFAGMEGEPPPGWLVCILVICMLIFCIPSTILGIVFGILCFPLVCICGCTNDDGEPQTLFQTMFGCWLIWLLIFIAIPALIIWVIISFVKAIYGLVRICCPCLPAWESGGRQNANANANANANQARPGGGDNRESLLTDVDNNNYNAPNVVKDNDVSIAIKQD